MCLFLHSWTAITVALAALGATCSSAIAQARRPASEPAEPLPASPDALGEPVPDPHPLHVAFTPYAWLTGFSGTVGVAGLEFEIEQSFADIFDESDSVFGLMGALHFEYKSFVFEVNGAFTHAEFSGERGRALSGPAGGGIGVGVDADIEVDATWFETLGGYRFIEEPLGEPDSRIRLTIDGFVGGRITTMEVKTNVTAEATVTLPGGRVLQAGAETSVDQDEAWFEPFLGARTALDLGEHWTLELRGDIGGFGVDGSDFAWQAIAAAGYRWHFEGWSLGVFGGYRALGQDYSRDGFTWDMVTHGPIVGAQFVFSF